MPRRRQMHKRIRRMGMRRFIKHGRRAGMTRLTRLTPDKLAARGMRRRLQPQPLKLHLFELFLISDLHLLNFRSIGKPMVERNTLVAEWRSAVLIESDN